MIKRLSVTGHKSKSVGRSPGVTNYTKEKIDALLEIVESKIPVTTAEWEEAVQDYNLRTTDDRDAESIRRKFRDLANLKKISPTTTTPEQIDRAKGLYAQVREKFAVLSAAEEAKENADKAALERQQASMVDENGDPIQIPGLDTSQALATSSSHVVDSGKAMKRFKGMNRLLLDTRVGDSNSYGQSTNSSNNVMDSESNANVTGTLLNQLSEQLMMMFTMLQQQAQQQQQQFMTMMQQQNVLLAAVLSESKKRKAVTGEIDDDANDDTEDDPEDGGVDQDRNGLKNESVISKNDNIAGMEKGSQELADKENSMITMV